MSRTGRPKALDFDKRQQICQLLSVGCTLRDAARQVGCDVSTIRREADRNEDFQEQLHDARCQAQFRPLQAIYEASSTNWRAAAWLLERLYPKRFCAASKSPRKQPSNKNQRSESAKAETSDAPIPESAAATPSPPTQTSWEHPGEIFDYDDGLPRPFDFSKPTRGKRGK